MQLARPLRRDAHAALGRNYWGQTKWPRKKAIAKTTRRIWESMNTETPTQKPMPIFCSRVMSFTIGNFIANEWRRFSGAGQIGTDAVSFCGGWSKKRPGRLEKFAREVGSELKIRRCL